ncbi:MAG: hypothetical protein BMS9Abin20_0628 [Acidimicrobiia bacterium]|nr:MAG: hypothetical protein BMS9Abin20_0628 [Acidimicrobiia bacterium]
MRTTMLGSVALIATITIALIGFQSTVTPTPAHAEIRDANFAIAVFPVDDEYARFKNTWGERRARGRRHTGTDIISPRGTAIRAAADGIITEMDYRASSGFYLRIDHGHGWQSTYLHLNNDTIGTDDGEGGTWTAFYPTLTVGAEVFAGDVIGYVGDSGNAEDTIPHAHLAITHKGESLNPYPYLEDAWDREHRFARSGLNPL